LPKQTRLLSRELIYTALTRSRDHLVLLVEGEDLSLLHAMSSPEKAEAVRRNTNIFTGILRALPDTPPYAEHLIHKTDKGHLVRSKTELIISNLIFDGGRGPKYEYESSVDGTQRPGRLFPDFSFVDAGGDRIIWEHLGRMDDPSYVAGWEWKRKWYEDNGFVLGQTLFSTEERHGQGLEMPNLRYTLETIKSRLG
jgi:hypothetical protein